MTQDAPLLMSLECFAKFCPFGSLWFRLMMLIQLRYSVMPRLSHTLRPSHSHVLKISKNDSSPKCEVMHETKFGQKFLI